MGQYYHPINLDKKEHLYTHDYDTGLKLMEHSWIGNDFVETVVNLLREGGRWYKNKIVWLGDYADDEELHKQLDNDIKKIKPKVQQRPKKYKYLTNHTKQLFVNLDEVVKGLDGWQIHPLPLLTCEGNGRGGGDYRGESYLIGSWARDEISIQKEKPNYEELIFNLVE